MVVGGWSDKKKVILNLTRFKFKLKLKLELSLAKIGENKLGLYWAKLSLS